MSDFVGILLVLSAIVLVLTPLITKKGSTKRRIAFTSAILSPVIAMILYLTTDSPTRVAADTTQATSQTTSQTLDSIKSAQLDSVENMASRLHKRLLKHPDDPEGWKLLAKSYAHMGDDKAANSANLRALETTASLLESTADSQPITLRGTIQIAPDLANRIQPDDTVFVYAKSANGPRMPIAAQQYSASNWPIEFTLNESNTLSKTRPLTNTDTVIVNAKISKSGDALAPEIEFIGTPIEVTTKNIESITILITSQSNDD